jgi:hypothetical protein
MPASVVSQVVNIQRAQLRGIIELGGVRKMRTVYEQARVDLERRLAELVRSGRGDTFSAHHLRMVLLQVRDGLVDIQRQMVPTLKQAGHASAGLAQRHTVSAIKKFEKRFSGTEPVLRIEEASVFSRVYQGVEPSLLARYHKLAANYPMPTITRVQKAMALHMVENGTVESAVDKVASATGIFAQERWRAERIVRTEMAYAYGVTGQKMLDETSHEVPRLMKRLVTTFDDRTGEDSEELNGQTVPYDKPFVWMKHTKAGDVRVEYMAPPNRPNDREAMIPWRDDYHSPALEAGPVDPEKPRGLGL